MFSELIHFAKWNCASSLCAIIHCEFVWWQWLPFQIKTKNGTRTKVQCAMYAFEIGVHHFLMLHCVMCNGAESIDGVACTAVAMGGIQWRGVDHIPGSGDIWAQVISHKHKI